MFILAYITDFFFQAKVSETAKQLGVPIKVVTSLSRFDLALQQNPSLVIVDLASNGVDCSALITKTKGKFPAISLVAFGAHVDAEILRRAAEAGADRTLPRSKFSRLLPEIVASAAPSNPDTH